MLPMRVYEEHVLEFAPFFKVHLGLFLEKSWSVEFLGWNLILGWFEDK